jgi:hypothetical protein
VSHSTRLSEDGAVIDVVHSSDWSGGVTVRWRYGEDRGEFRIPGAVARVLLHGYNFGKYDKLVMRLRELLEDTV